MEIRDGQGYLEITIVSENFKHFKMEHNFAIFCKKKFRIYLATIFTLKLLVNLAKKYYELQVAHLD